MRIDFNNWTIIIEFCPIFGIAFGVNYFNPRMVDDEVLEEEYYEDITFLLSVIALKIRWWKN